MAKKHLKREPHDISEDIWWYEENKGMTLVVRFSDGAGRSEVHTIPWKTIRAALKRKDRND